MTFMVARRTREIGIRMALGAAERDVTRQIVGEALRITLWGTGIGVVGAVTLARILQVQFQGVRPLDPLSYLLVAILLGAVTLAAAYVPARRARRVDPMVALRAE
jgi:ABC-type antimicrobial peptide transport system permease subunit